MEVWLFSPIIFATGFALLYTKWIATRIAGVLVVGVALAIAWSPDDVDNWYMAVFLAAVGGIAFFVYPPSWLVLATDSTGMSSSPRFAKFNIKRLLIFVVFMSILFAAIGYRMSIIRNQYSPLNRSWQSGTLAVDIHQIGAEKAVSVIGNWPDATAEQWIKFSLWLTQDGSKDAFLVGGSHRLSHFKGTGVGDYSDGASNIDRSRSYRAVFDYEIWDGSPNRGKLLKKDSVFSQRTVDSDG